MVARCEVLSSPGGHRADDVILKITKVFNQVGSRNLHSSTPVWKWRIFFTELCVTLCKSIMVGLMVGFSFNFFVCMWRSECTCLHYDFKETSKNGHTSTCPKLPSFLVGTSH